MSLASTNDKSFGVKVDGDLPDDVDILKFLEQHAAELRFPEKLMMLMTYVERVCLKRGEKPEQACLSWSRDGHALIIRNHDELVNRLLPLVLQTKGRFSSFTRKLYRWGFRQRIIKTAKGTTPPRPATNVKVFFHKLFQRGNKKLLADMKCASSDRTNKETLSLPPISQARYRRDVANAVIPHFSMPQVHHGNEQNGLLSLLTGSYKQRLEEAACSGLSSLTSLGPSNLLYGNPIGRPSLATNSTSPVLLSALARQQAMILSSPFFPTIESDLLQHDLAMQLLKRKRVQDIVSSAWQSLPPMAAPMFQPTTYSDWGALP